MNHPSYTIRVQLASITLEDLKKLCGVFSAEISQVGDNYQIEADDPEVFFWIGLNIKDRNMRCTCKPADRCGETSVMCCNRCGRPAEYEKWWIE